MKTLPVLVVEDDAPLREALCDTLELAGYSVVAAADGGEALRLLERDQVGIVVSDVQMQPMDGLTLLHRLRETRPDIPVLMMTAFGDIEHAVRAMQAGASHYLAKPFEPQRLLSEVARFMLTAGPANTDEAPTEDAQMAETLALARRVAHSDATVLISGESGTGKEVLARFIHRNSPRSALPFVAINCAAIPEALLEATLFGHEKGAFTGAAQAQAGKFEQAQHGTLLLDEISEMPLLLQTKLLRVLQEREVERVGGGRRSGWIFGSLPPQTAIWRQRWRPAAFARICITGSMYFLLSCRRCGSGAPTSCRWPSSFCGAMRKKCSAVRWSFQRRPNSRCCSIIGRAMSGSWKM